MSSAINFLLQIRAVNHAERSDTTGIALATILRQLACNKAWLEKLREQVDSAIKAGTFDPKIPIPAVEAVIQETLRLYPPALIPYAREIPQGIRIKDTYLPARTIVVLHPYPVQRGNVDTFSRRPPLILYFSFLPTPETPMYIQLICS